ncbi:MAG: SDR family oxidoreductase [Akkermansiaceae bacterium]|nr:SDR family oxidoreductase [Armatimonadota bacterium]
MNPLERWRLTGKTALVTGGTKGIGYAIADELLRLGATVTVAARTEADVTDCVAKWRSEGLNPRGMVTDLSKPDAAETLIASLGDSLDILINNVGTNVRKPTTEYTNEEYRHVLATNLDSAFALSRAAHPLLARSGDGAIVNIGSVAGTVAILSGLPYAMTKAALDQMTRYLAVEWAKDGIRVNAVNPWYTRTPLASPRLADPAFVQRVLDATPLKRIAEPEDVAGVVAFLCLPAAHHITGQTVAVDGGFLAQGLA